LFLGMIMNGVLPID